MSTKRKRPGRLWLFFWGRKRRGFPGLLVGVLALAIALGLLFGLPGGADLSRYAVVVTVSALALVTLAAVVAIVIALLRPRGPR